ncbi:MAG: putative 4-mercaptohistidine N1-methyltransferase [Opitutae bacterium]|nr:putative 4-mercaptohistidine N1-methyltransferase [Opitutae bacterium]
MKNPYESSRLLGEYLLFHYGSKEDLMPWMNGPANGVDFALRTVSELIDPTTLGMGTHALDLGCAVGRSTFELASHCSKVKGIDNSSSFVEAANELVDKGSLSYRFREEGDLFKEAVALVPENQRSKVVFEIGDACSLSPSLGYFDVVHAANLLCRLPDPNLLLNRLPDLVKPGGQLLLATPFTWLEEFTARENWLGSGDSEEELTRILSPDFELEEKREMPFVIREHRRKFQYSVAFGTRWRRLQP